MLSIIYCLGKNDGSVNGHRYFTCRDKCGIFVKTDKLIQDKRGRSLRRYSKQEVLPCPTSTVIRKSTSKGINYFHYEIEFYKKKIYIFMYMKLIFFKFVEGLHSLHRSQSRGEGLSTIGFRTVTKK